MGLRSYATFFRLFTEKTISYLSLKISINYIPIYIYMYVYIYFKKINKYLKNGRKECFCSISFFKFFFFVVFISNVSQFSSSGRNL